MFSGPKQLGSRMGQCRTRLARRDIHSPTSTPLVGADRRDNLTMKLIEADTRTEAWLKAAEFLLCNGPSLNLVLEIRSPDSKGPYPTARRYIDEFLDPRRKILDAYGGGDNLPRLRVPQSRGYKVFSKSIQMKYIQKSRSIGIFCGAPTPTAWFDDGRRTART